MPRRARRRSRRSTCLSSPGVPPRRLCPRRNACNCRPPLPRAVAQEQARRPRRQARSYSSGGASRAWFGPATCRARGGGPRRRVPARRRKSGDGPRLRAGRGSPRIPWTSCVGAPIRAAEFPYHARGAVPALDVQFDGPLPVFV